MSTGIAHSIIESRNRCIRSSYSLFRPGPYQQAYLRHAPCMRQVWKTYSFTFFLKKIFSLLHNINNIYKIINLHIRRAGKFLIQRYCTKLKQSRALIFISGSRRLSRMQCSLPGGTSLGKNIQRQFVAKLCGNQIDPLIYNWMIHN